MDLQLQAAVRLLLEHVRRHAAEGRRRAGRVLALDRPFGRGDDEIALAVVDDLEQLELVVKLLLFLFKSIT